MKAKETKLPVNGIRWPCGLELGLLPYWEAKTGGASEIERSTRELAANCPMHGRTCHA